MTFVERVQITNYKSIATCDVSLTPFTLLVGPNGSGKSNFVDALRLVTDSLQTTIDHALRERGSAREVRRRSHGHPTHFTIALWLSLPQAGPAHYAFRIAPTPNGGFAVQREKAQIPGLQAYYDVKDGEVIRSSFGPPPRILSDSLFLTAVSGFSEFRGLFQALASMGFYNINPMTVRDLQDHDEGRLLRRDGSNLASVLRRLEAEDRETFERIRDYLSAIVPAVAEIEPKDLGPKQTIEFRQRVAGAEHPWRFFAASMSDGTLRALGVLTALFQAGRRREATAPLIGVEEPEATIHPGAATIVMDALLEASATSQIIVTTHSPDLLDHPRVDADTILSVDMDDGQSMIAPAHPAAISAIRDKLFSPGDLLRDRQLDPDASKVPGRLRERDLFADLAAADG